MTEPITEPVTVINLITMPADAADAFIAAWATNSATLRDAPGFRGTRLLRALSPDDPYQIANVAQWDSVEQWKTALAVARPEAEQRRETQNSGIQPQHLFYRVVSITPDPRDPSTGT